MIHTKQHHVSQLSQQCEDLADESLRVEQQRKQLAPQVTKWKAYEAKASVFQTRKTNFMQQQADSLARSISATSIEVDRHHMQLIAAKDKADQLHDQLQDISHEKAQSAQQHQSASKHSAELAKQLDAAHENLARAQVRQAAAVQAAKQQSEADKSRQKRIKVLQTQQTKARSVMPPLGRIGA
ncbi:hypothetical protein ABBQ32_000287 [Trebouxia sp. C0010 RCD-2024]